MFLKPFNCFGRVSVQKPWLHALAMAPRTVKILKTRLVESITSNRVLKLKLT